MREIERKRGRKQRKLPKAIARQFLTDAVPEQQHPQGQLPISQLSTVPCAPGSPFGLWSSWPGSVPCSSCCSPDSPQAEQSFLVGSTAHPKPTHGTPPAPRKSISSIPQPSSPGPAPAAGIPSAPRAAEPEPLISAPVGPGTTCAPRPGGWLNMDISWGKSLQPLGHKWAFWGACR